MDFFNKDVEDLLEGLSKAEQGRLTPIVHSIYDTIGQLGVRRDMIKNAVREGENIEEEIEDLYMQVKVIHKAMLLAVDRLDKYHEELLKWRRPIND